MTIECPTNGDLAIIATQFSMHFNCLFLIPLS